MKEKAVILIGFTPNQRIMRRLKIESELFETHLVCWNRGENMIPFENKDFYMPHVINIVAGSEPIKRLIPTKKFSNAATKILIDIKPVLIHVQGLDMLQIAVNYKKKSKYNVNIIYEVADLHRYIVDEQKQFYRKVLRKYLIYKDKTLQKYYQFLILTSEAYFELYFKTFVSKDKVLYMPNIPDLNIFKNYQKKNTGDFVVGYIGGIRYKKQIFNLLEAATKCNVKLLFAGFERQPAEIEPMCRNNDNIDWYGAFNYDQMAPILYQKCDVMYSVYDADMANVRVALPNKLYEAVYCEMPIIVAKNTYLAEIVNQWGVGIAVDHRDHIELMDAINKLKHPETYDIYVRNCRRQRELLKVTNPDDFLRKALKELFARKANNI